MKRALATVAVLFCFGCVRQSEPVSAPTVVEIPPVRPKGPVRHVVRVNELRREFHYSFRLQERSQWVVIPASRGKDDIVGAPADLVLRSTVSTAFITFHAVNLRGEHLVSIAANVALDLSYASFQTSELQAWKPDGTAHGLSLSWTRSLPDGREFAGRAFFVGYDDIPGYGFVVSGMWQVTYEASVAEGTTEMAAWSLAVVSKLPTEK